METISKIERKTDNKIFSCFFRNGIVKDKDIEQFSNRSDWISEDKEEISLYNVNKKLYKILEKVEI
jgi:hypothetical protein